MSWNHLSHDICAYNKFLKESVSPLAYQLDPLKFENCNKCRIQIGTPGGTAVSHINGNLVDLENDLRGQTRPLTHCPSHKFHPNTYKSRQMNAEMKHLRPCQIVNYKEVPLPPPIKLSACER